jgi:polyribonucleotide nucleotidyltransferase
VHISKLGRGKRIAKVEDVVNVGDKLRVEIADIAKRGKISLVLVDEGAEEAAESGNGEATPEKSPAAADSSAPQRAGDRPASSPSEADAATASS